MKSRGKKKIRTGVDVFPKKQKKKKKNFEEEKEGGVANIKVRRKQGQVKHTGKRELRKEGVRKTAI